MWGGNKVVIVSRRERNLTENVLKPEEKVTNILLFLLVK